MQQLYIICENVVAEIQMDIPEPMFLTFNFNFKKWQRKCKSLTWV